MELWKGNRRGQGSSVRAVTTHRRDRHEAARGRWRWRCEDCAQVSQKHWVTGRKRRVSCGIIGERQSRESALSDSYFIAFLISQPWIIEAVGHTKKVAIDPWGERCDIACMKTLSFQLAWHLSWHKESEVSLGLGWKEMARSRWVKRAAELKTSPNWWGRFNLPNWW